MEIIAQLRASRIKKRMNQFDLALKLGKPQSYISKIETCERRIDLAELLEICEVLKIKISQIVPHTKKMSYERKKD